MRLYRYSGQLEFHGAVEARTLSEATNMVDRILAGASSSGGEIIIKDAEDDTLTVSSANIRRGRIQVEN
jgi:hypothetical protein